MTNKSIALIVCYYGKFPWYFSFFLHSCKYNPDVTFYIITDNEVKGHEIPQNVFIIKKSLQQFKQEATHKLGFEVKIDYPYKLCDFKPAYGFIFSEFIQPYDFWGYTDLDVIFGNIRSFITDELLNSYEFISVRHDILTGYFQLYKNKKEINNLFMESKDYKTVFSSQKHYCFDETNFAFDEFKGGVPYNEIKSEIESMMHVVKKMEETKRLKAYFDFHVIEGTPGKLKWEKGKLTYKNEYEVILYHLIKLKEVYHPNYSRKRIPDVFRISPTCIY
ncbi:MAG: DUF6625 family protein [Ginsengibacter sp.]